MRLRLGSQMNENTGPVKSCRQGMSELRSREI